MQRPSQRQSNENKTRFNPSPIREQSLLQYELDRRSTGPRCSLPSTNPVGPRKQCPTRRFYKPREIWPRKREYLSSRPAQPPSLASEKVERPVVSTDRI